MRRMVIGCFVSLMGGVSPVGAWASHAIAYAFAGRDDVHVYWVGGQPSRRAAEQQVLDDCHAGAKKSMHSDSCKLAGSADGPAYGALFFTDSGDFYFASDASKKLAIDAAYRGCRKKGKCADTAAKVWFDGGQELRGRFHEDGLEFRQDFLSDPAFIARVAKANGMNPIRFHSLETSTQMQMIRDYLRKSSQE